MPPSAKSIICAGTLFAMTFDDGTLLHSKTSLRDALLINGPGHVDNLVVCQGKGIDSSCLLHTHTSLVAYSRSIALECSLREEKPACLKENLRIKRGSGRNNRENVRAEISFRCPARFLAN